MCLCLNSFICTFYIDFGTICDIHPTITQVVGTLTDGSAVTSSYSQLTSTCSVVFIPPPGSTMVLELSNVNIRSSGGTTLSFYGEDPNFEEVRGPRLLELTSSATGLAPISTRYGRRIHVTWTAPVVGGTGFQLNWKQVSANTSNIQNICQSSAPSSQVAGILQDAGPGEWNCSRRCVHA